MSFRDEIMNEFDPLMDGGNRGELSGERNSANKNADADISVKEEVGVSKTNEQAIDSNNVEEGEEENIPVKATDLKTLRKTDARAVMEVEKSDENNDMDGNIYDFQLFLEQFKNPNAEPLVKYTRSFLHNFLTQRSLWTTQEQQKLINDFKIFIYEKFSLYEPFKSMDWKHLNNAQEGIEKLIMGKLYNNCYSPNLKLLLMNKIGKLDKGHEQDIKDDKLLCTKSKEFKFIKPNYLDISFTNAAKNGTIIVDKFIKISGQELDKINKFKSPRDKVVCILNSCKVIFSILKHHKLEQNGADSFIPFLIYTILKNDIVHLPSNIKYIERFRYDAFIRGEASYYLSSLQAAVNFIITMDKSSLTIDDEDEYNKLYKENQKLVRKHSEELKREKEQVKHERTQHVAAISPSEYIIKPLDGATNALASKFNDLLSSFNESNDQHNSSNMIEDTRDVENDALSHIVEMIEEKEHKQVVENLTSMFPDMLREIIEDICIAKKYNFGECVDALLSLSD